MATVTIRRPGFDGAVTKDGVREALAAPGVVTIAATSTVSESPRIWILALAYGALAVAAAAAYIARDGLRDPLALAMGASAFALFYVAAQAEERLLEPFTQFVLPTDPGKEAVEKAKGLAATAPDSGEALNQAKIAADQAAELKRTKSERAILFWALATVIGIGLSMWLGLYFFAAILAAADAIPRWVDVVATGLVVGGGTKALHDLIGKTQKPEPDSGTTTP